MRNFISNPDEYVSAFLPFTKVTDILITGHYWDHEWPNCIGVTGAAFDSYLTLRGLRTLHARMRAHGENAAEVLALLGTLVQEYSPARHGDGELLWRAIVTPPKGDVLVH